MWEGATAIERNDVEYRLLVTRLRRGPTKRNQTPSGTGFLHKHRADFGQAATHLSIIIWECPMNALLFRGYVIEMIDADDALVSWWRLAENFSEDGSRRTYAFLVQKASSTCESNYEFFWGFSPQKTPHGYTSPEQQKCTPAAPPP